MKNIIIETILASIACAIWFYIGTQYKTLTASECGDNHSDKYFISYAYTSDQGFGVGNITSEVAPKDANDLDYIAEKAKSKLGFKDFTILSWQKF